MDVSMDISMDVFMDISMDISMDTSNKTDAQVNLRFYYFFKSVAIASKAPQSMSSSPLPESGTCIPAQILMHY